MLKLMIFGRRASGMTRRAAQSHLRNVHGRMVVCPPADAGAMPVDYVQNHVTDGAYPANGGPHGIERDLVTQLWFEDINHLRASTSTPYYLDNLKPDEPRFVDDATVEKMIVRPQNLAEGTGGLFKAFLLVSSAADTPADNAVPTAFDINILLMEGIVAAVRNVVEPAPDGKQPFGTFIYELRFADKKGAYRAVDDFAAFIGNAPDSIDASRSFALVAEQYDTPRLAAGF